MGCSCCGCREKSQKVLEPSKVQRPKQESVSVVLSPKPKQRKPESGPVVPPSILGLPRTKLNCYLNAVMQCLFATPQFMEAVRRSSGTLAHEIVMLKTHRRMEVIESIGGKVMERFGEMQCANVFFMNLVNKLVEEETSSGVAFIGLFEVEAEYLIKPCHIPPSKNRYLSLSLPLPPVSDEPIDISKCFSLLTQPKPLSFSCDLCTSSNKEHCASIEKTSDILVVHFQRFLDGEKDNRIVAFGSEFTVIVKNVQQRYRVYGVVYHCGSLNGGHYTAWVQDAHHNWWEANDSSVKQQRDRKPPFENAYLLFCVRKEA